MGSTALPLTSTPTRPSGSWALVEADTSGVLFGYDTLAGRIARTGILLAAVANLTLALFIETTPALRVTRGVVAAAEFGVFAWILRRVPSPRFLRTVGILICLQVIVGIVLDSHRGWPVSLDLVPAACVYFALVVGWRLSLAMFLGAGAAITMALSTGFAPIPPHLPVIAGNWVVVGTVLLFILHRLIRTFSAGARDLVVSARSLEMARAQATAVTEELAQRVSQRVEALAASLPEGVPTAAAATQALRETLRQSRQRIPPEATLSFGKLRGRVTEVRRQLLRTGIWVGGILLPLQAMRLWVAGVPTLAALVLTEFVVLLGVLGALRRHPAHWRRIAHVTAGCLLLAYVGSFTYWIHVPEVPRVPPSVTLNLLTVVMLGIVTGDLRLVLTTGGLMGGAAVVIGGAQGVATAVVCLVFTVAGAMVTSLPRDLLNAIQARREEASAAIRRRRRLVGTLFHDLANPLTVIVATLEEAREDGMTGVPAEVARMVARMRATIDGALGRQQVEEALPVGVLIEALLAVFRARLEAKSITLLRSGAMELVVRGRRSLLQDSVLANLLSNAIKFSPVGGTIMLHAVRDGNRVRLEVRDSGPGMPAEVRTAVDAGRVAPSRTGTAGEIGSGYGLLLARDYVEEMGGTLAFHHPETGGLTAQLSLPAG